MNRTIILKDGIEVEVELSGPEEISYQDHVNSSISELGELLKKTISPVSNTLKELNKEVAISETKVTLGVKIGAEGNFFIAKSSLNANIQVEMLLKEK